LRRESSHLGKPDRSSASYLSCAHGRTYRRTTRRRAFPRRRQWSSLRRLRPVAFAASAAARRRSSPSRRRSACGGPRRLPAELRGRRRWRSRALPTVVQPARASPSDTGLPFAGTSRSREWRRTCRGGQVDRDHLLVVLSADSIEVVKRRRKHYAAPVQAMLQLGEHVVPVDRVTFGLKE